MAGLFKSIREDIAAVLERDPAARSRVEVFFCYPGLHALWTHRVSHWLWRRKLYLVARMLSCAGRFFTNIDIHPGAQIGRKLFMDHGIGIVIGETAIIGDGVTLYQGVSLGGTGKEKGKRHPTLRNHVVVGAGAKVLGNIVIGENCRLGAGCVVLRDVPENSTVVGVPGHIVYRDGKRVVITDPKEISDPIADVISSFASQLNSVQCELDALKARVRPGCDRGKDAILASLPFISRH
jgi:serine O-acetyltransferase